MLSTVQQINDLELQEDSLEKVEVEVEISKGVERVEALFCASGMDKKPRSRMHWCGNASELVKHAIEYSGPDQESQFSGELKIVRTWTLHAVTQNKDVAELDRRLHTLYESPDEAVGTFRHTVCLLESQGHVYLLDLTFCQFIDEETGTVNNVAEDGEGVETGYPLDAPLVTNLLKNGYVELTSEILKEYLLATMDQNRHEMLVGAFEPLEVFKKLRCEEPELSKDELDERCFFGVPLR